ncbi:DUF2225 domain-containing protein [Clostridium sp. SYSU_GA19001]|uniref:DUF2225 domain-containing protein n=1 Tax=Clostridium caldaquaticum TaxID=2940653 RepID=UPI002077213D|nr:DUF2225 domain-containing protein [Clostridium caldaquaticum]MCM8711078.1 DUF2225 domain-containing protein [Clostridium caldaquaticum]
MNDNIFSGLEGLGFDDVQNIKLFNEKENEVKKISKDKKEDNPKELLYDIKLTCPVCGNIFYARAVKSSAIRRQKSDSDFFIRYTSINPYFYEVYLCNACGYAALKQDFEKIRDFQIEIIQQKISPKWQGRRYPEVYDAEIAIERFKLALLNNVLIGSKSSKKALNCLRIAWMYRLLNDDKNELLFLNQALEGFNDAYMNEDFPICGMDKFTTTYLIGELYRRTGSQNEALLWFSKVITTPNVPQKLKNIARDQRDLIKEETENLESPEISSDNYKKPGFFSKFFK